MIEWHVVIMSFEFWREMTESTNSYVNNGAKNGDQRLHVKSFSNDIASFCWLFYGSHGFQHLITDNINW